MNAVYEFLKRRLAETSSWIHIGSAISTSVVIPAPYSYLAFFISFVGVLVPDAKLIKELQELDDA